MISHLLTSRRLLIVALVLAFAWAGAGGGPSHAQNLPSWAEPSNPQHRSSSDARTEPRRKPRDPHSEPGSSSQLSNQQSSKKPGQWTDQPGGMRTQGTTGEGPCDVSEDCPGYPNAYCAPDKGKNGKCYSNGSGPGNGENGEQSPPDVPIDSHGIWLILAGLTYGGYRLI